jgi:hypothetical protein
MTQLLQDLTDNFVAVAVAVIGCLLALAFLTPTTARASESDLRTDFSVNHPVEVPGMTLQPNTRYTIRLYDSSSTRDVVQILNAHDRKLLTEFLARADERLEPAGKTTFTFIEMEPGYPMPIKEWFYPGHKTGLEFIYPPKQALEIARHAKEPVLGAESVDLDKLAAEKVEAVSPLGADVPDTAENGPKAELSRADQATIPNPAIAGPLPQQQPKAPAIAGYNEPEIQKPVPPPAPRASANTEETTPLESVKAAGKLPLIALLGVCLGAGLGMKACSSAMSRNQQRPNFPRRTFYR